MKRIHLVAALVAIGIGVVCLWWFTTGTGSERASVDRPSEAATAKPSSRRPRPQPPELAATRKVTEEDVPATSAEAVARPEYSINRAMAYLRSNFAQGRHDLVITKAKNLLAANPEQPKVRAFLTMSACATQDESLAREHFGKLPPKRQEFVAKRCARFGTSVQ